MQGKIIKGIAGFYYVNIEGKGIFECNAKGAFRNAKIKPLVGDDVLMDVVDEEKLKGNVAKILERKSEMIRPACANVDQALVIFSIRTPDPNFNLLDRFLVYMESCEIPAIICFNKDDLANAGDIEMIKEAYKNSGYGLLFVSAKKGEGIKDLEALLAGKTTVVAGPSGVGKSSLINLLCGETAMETGNISVKTERGRHTTRHSELLHIGEDTYIMDTPGFTSLDVFGAGSDTLKYYYNEFSEYNDLCRFRTCVHVNEPSCAVKQAVEEGTISKMRYENYLELYKELAEKERTKYS
ncbi:MAG: ribosome small subunit-dependent GTPase A [Lachnospiraceae bacterium]|nr:ribosome small subunit-dependent GTPase A [Lachnospiraceae bacterium]